MKKFIIKYLILVLTVFVIFSLNAFCDSQWDNFLQKPNKDSLTMLEKTVSDSAKNCNPDFTPTQIHRARLFELIRKGNQMAFRAALLVSRCWDGGEFEDFNRSVGTFFEIQPRTFLQIVNEKVISDLQLRYFLTMLPLYTVDNIDLKISMMENRMAILEGVNEESFKKIKKRGLFFLKKERDNLYKIKSDLL